MSENKTVDVTIEIPCDEYLVWNRGLAALKKQESDVHTINDMVRRYVAAGIVIDATIDERDCDTCEHDETDCVVPTLRCKGYKKIEKI